MTMHDRQPRQIPAEIRAMLARARPDQIRRLFTDIRTVAARNGQKGEA